MSLSDSWAAGRPEYARVSAAAAVLADLRAAIEKGDLPVGERLPAEAALAGRYGVSRSVVREALRSSETLGLTQTQTGRGTFVVADHVPAALPVGHYSSNEILEARPHVEVPAAGLAARRRTSEQRDALRELLDQMNDANDPDEWVALDAAFHAAVAAASGNRVFVDLLATMGSALIRQSETLNLVANRREKANQEHAEIVAAIDEGSVDRAEQAMSTHLEAVHRALAKVIEG